MPDVFVDDLSRADHAEAVLQLLDEYARDIMGRGNEALPEYTKENLISELSKRSDTHIILLFTNGQPVGLAICFEGFSTFACKPLLNIHDLTIVPAARGQGFSKHLLSRIEKLATELECCKLTLEVLEGNVIAQNAYKKFGFENYELSPAAGRAMFFEKRLSSFKSGVL